ncbi:hypothetical protein BDZ91DRAFT_721884 [Kalaharituber pfeilii]|nr:hypothetical protein BDZ91DRAFT_721884 [Kalaharituber pfeilii]
MTSLLRDANLAMQTWLESHGYISMQPSRNTPLQFSSEGALKNVGKISTRKEIKELHSYRDSNDIYNEESEDEADKINAKLSDNDDGSVTRQRRMEKDCRQYRVHRREEKSITEITFGIEDLGRKERGFKRDSSPSPSLISTPPRSRDRELTPPRRKTRASLSSSLLRTPSPTLRSGKSPKPSPRTQKTPSPEKNLRPTVTPRAQESYITMLAKSRSVDEARRRAHMMESSMNAEARARYEEACKSWLPTDPRINPNAINNLRRKMSELHRPTFVYIALLCEEAEEPTENFFWVKIGQSEDVSQRMRSHYNCNLTLICAFPVRTAHKVEGLVHAELQGMWDVYFGGRACKYCEKTHKEFYRVERSEEGLKWVIGRVEYWVNFETCMQLNFG